MRALLQLKQDRSACFLLMKKRGGGTWILVQDTVHVDISGDFYLLFSEYMYHMGKYKSHIFRN